ncbi:MAG: c-type cytochrome [Chloroflexi bacterium]|nr:c-type cytochrome [Chloroflexota bacterium]
MDLNVILAAVSVLIFVALLAFFAFLVKHQADVEPEEKPVYGVELLEQHYAPGSTVEQPTPYYVAPIPAAPDPLEISANLDKKIVVGAAMLFGLFGLIGAYLLIQPALRAEAVEHQLSLDVRRGKALYASLCYDCHGRDGRGGTNPEGKQLPGLPLNKAEFKYEAIKADPAAVERVRRLLVSTIEQGRERPAPAYSMPAWARSHGGPLGAWQIKQLADLIMYGHDEDWADMPHIREEHGQTVAEVVPDPPKPPSGDVIARQVCAVCHSFTAGQASTSPLAPNLARYGVEGPIVAELRRAKDSGDADWLVKWVTNPASIKPGSAMPPYGQSAGGQLPEASVRLVVQYLLTLGR